MLARRWALIDTWPCPLPQDHPGIFSAGLDLTEMCGKNPAHYAEYWKAVQELWLRLYLSNMTLVAAINVSVPFHGASLALRNSPGDRADMAEKRASE